MNATELTYLINHPKNITTQNIEKLEEIILEFPYFQSARAIQLKGLHTSKSYKYNAALKKTAAYTIDRNILFEFITSSSFIENFKTQIVTPKSEILPEKKLSENKKTENSELQNEATEILEIGKPIEFKNTEPHTFNEWMKISVQKPIIRTKSTSKSEIIDTFIKSNPKIKPVSKQHSIIDISKESSLENKDLMTETLAKVYLEQKKYTKAAQAYHILSLKYPEKSSFFANRIKAIKILQKNIS